MTMTFTWTFEHDSVHVETCWLGHKQKLKDKPVLPDAKCIVPVAYNYHILREITVSTYKYNNYHNYHLATLRDTFTQYNFKNNTINIWRRISRGFLVLVDIVCVVVALDFIFKKLIQDYFLSVSTCIKQRNYYSHTTVFLLNVQILKQNCSLFRCCILNTFWLKVGMQLSPKGEPILGEGEGAEIR